MRLKICDSRLTCKVANKCLNVRERLEEVEWNKQWSPPFPCCPVNSQCLWKKTLIEKKKKSYPVLLIWLLIFPPSVLHRKMRNINKISKLRGNSLLLGFPSKKKFILAVKNYPKTNTKIYQYSPTLLRLFIENWDLTKSYLES